MASTIRGSDDFNSDTSIIYDKLSSGSFVGAGSVEITLSGSYNVYELLLNSVRNSSTNVVYYARWKSGSTTYTSGYKSNGANGRTYMTLGVSDGNAENVGITGTLSIYEPHSSTHYPQCVMVGASYDNDAFYQSSPYSYGGMLENTANMTSILIDASNTSNFTHGTWTLYGVKT